MSISMEIFEVALPLLTAAGLIRKWRKERSESQAENAKLFEMYTAMQERLDKLSATPPKPELDENGKELPPRFPVDSLNHLDTMECPFCKVLGKVTYNFCHHCTSIVYGEMRRMFYGHFHVNCGACGANYYQREKKS